MAQSYSQVTKRHIEKNVRIFPTLFQLDSILIDKHSLKHYCELGTALDILHVLFLSILTRTSTGP